MDAFMGAEFADSKCFLSFYSEWSMVPTTLQQCYHRYTLVDGQNVNLQVIQVFDQGVKDFYSLVWYTKLVLARTACKH